MPRHSGACELSRWHAQLPRGGSGPSAGSSAFGSGARLRRRGAAPQDAAVTRRSTRRVRPDSVVCARTRASVNARRSVIGPAPWAPDVSTDARVERGTALVAFHQLRLGSTPDTPSPRWRRADPASVTTNVAAAPSPPEPVAPPPSPSVTVGNSPSPSRCFLAETLPAWPSQCVSPPTLSGALARRRVDGCLSAAKVRSATVMLELTRLARRRHCLERAASASAAALEWQNHVDAVEVRAIRRRRRRRQQGEVEEAQEEQPPRDAAGSGRDHASLGSQDPLVYLQSDEEEQEAEVVDEGSEEAAQDEAPAEEEVSREDVVRQEEAAEVEEREEHDQKYEEEEKGEGRDAEGAEAVVKRQRIFF
eukprot:TRINITY_DN25602_c0_g1_i3.p1 TRINITY_DN25602_c0_g1~~TRINITY_DN25602_c0_g1_i3.p1  ORF type:complete len:378 (-),score=69.48 TRINITY_DN25602_c0_g1_i3:59-1147(-)